jgi:putative ABC transport system permease protein
LNSTLQFLQKTWQSFNPDGAYEYFFIDDSLEQLHRADTQFGQLFGYFAGLAIFIACLGLLGLATYSTEQRTKEIGVRKVLGASVSNLLLLLSRDFTRMVILAFILDAPIAHLAMTHRFERFVYKIEIGVGTFLLAGLAAPGFAWLTVLYQGIKASTANPIESLRYE